MHKVVKAHRINHKVNIEKDLTTGKLFSQMVFFSLPIILTNVLQIVFNTADVMVLGVFVSDRAVAAVGSTGSLINLLTMLVIGMSTGTNVLLSKYVGAHDEDGVKKTVGVSVLISVVLGVLLIAVGLIFSRPMLELMGCDPNVIDLADKYVKIYFLGMPLVILYNFTSAILRASGDSVRPLIYLIIGGVLNVGLNVVFVLVFGMDVDGVAIATVIAQGVSAFLSIVALLRAKGIVKLRFKYLRFYKKELSEIFKIGFPTGIQSSLFSLSNVVLQAAINGFGEFAMAGSSYAMQIDSYIYVATNGVSIALMSFISQNYGARKTDRIKLSIKYGITLSVMVSLVLGIIATFITKPIVGALTNDTTVIDFAVRRAVIVCPSYFLCGFMDTFSNSLRGLNKSFAGMVITLLGACALRIVWIYTFIPITNSYEMIFISYPVTWLITALVEWIVLSKTIKNLKYN